MSFSGDMPVYNSRGTALCCSAAVTDFEKSSQDSHCLNPLLGLLLKTGLAFISIM